MVEIKGHTEDTWWVIKKSDNSIIKYGMTDVGLTTTSGLDEKETFTSELNWANKLLDYDLIITGETTENIIYSGDTWVGV
tara:strand:- start:1783 stop:2022 length:240 start_codon:yes stop_codon:yes gene_type:complete